jgi:hypothetical protein
MKNKPVYNCLLGLLLMFACTATAQNFKEDFSSVQRAYSRLDNFYCEISVKMYEKHTSGKPGETMHSYIKKHKGNFSYSMGDMKMIVNEKCILYINDREKQMVYTIRDTKRELKVPSHDAAAIVDSLVKKSDSVVFVTGKGSVKEYIVYSSKGLITKTHLSIDKESSLIKIIEYYYNPDKSPAADKVVIEYQQMNTAPSFSDDDFSEKKYVAYSGKVLKPFPPYTGYGTAIIDQREIK